MKQSTIVSYQNGGEVVQGERLKKIEKIAIQQQGQWCSSETSELS